MTVFVTAYHRKQVILLSGMFNATGPTDHEELIAEAQIADACCNTGRGNA